MHAILNFSFFRTLSMEEDFATKELNGAVQLISIFMQRSGHSIKEIAPISIDSSGQVITRENPAYASGSKGIHLTCIENKTGMEKDVYYLSCDISDLGLSRNKRLQAFLNQLPTVRTYIKSASYLLHKPYFSVIRKTIGITIMTLVNIIDALIVVIMQIVVVCIIHINMNNIIDICSIIADACDMPISNNR